MFLIRRRTRGAPCCAGPRRRLPFAAGHPALARLVHAYAGAEGHGDWAAGNLRMLFDSAPPEHLREAGGSKWHFL